ncbi:hypothetical protein Q2941_47865 [Bradyrhizobium sp. UFLA05-153]
MGQKTEPSGADQVYVLGFDDDGNPRGARFTILKDSIVSAAMDMNCRVLINQPPAVSSLGMKLPVGLVRGTGKLVTLFIPNISRELYNAIMDALRRATEQQDSRVEQATSRTIH